jgi:hypothetical protein
MMPVATIYLAAVAQNRLIRARTEVAKECLQTDEAPFPAAVPRADRNERTCRSASTGREQALKFSFDYNRK